MPQTGFPSAFIIHNSSFSGCLVLTPERALVIIPTVPCIWWRPGSARAPVASVLARQCLDAGAQFLTSDGLHRAVIEFAAQEEIVGIPGALTPTEVMAAWEARSDFVKVVPCVQIGGEAYMGSLHRMFPHIPLIAAGGVNQQNATNFVVAGAIALGIGRELIPTEAIRRRQPDRISELARRFSGFVKAGRAHLTARQAGGSSP